MKPVIKFTLSLSISLIIVFLIHIFLLYHNNLPLFNNKIIAAYLINFLLALLIYYILYFLRYKYSHQLGFMFMAGSFLKFIIFFLVFFPSYKIDGKMDMLEFAAFFVPYSISLIFETLGVIRILRNLKF